MDARTRGSGHHVGQRPERSEVYDVSSTELKRLAHLGYQGEAAFDWGCVTDGALDLAFAVLVHATEDRPTDRLCRAFCGEVVACLDPAGFVLSRGDIALWLPTVLCEGDASRDGRVLDPRVGRGGRAAARIQSWLRRT
ncbi:MAG: DUF6166 domain-containing protein [Solirubrobacteraceae bacterium]